MGCLPLVRCRRNCPPPTRRHVSPSLLVPSASELCPKYWCSEQAIVEDNVYSSVFESLQFPGRPVHQFHFFS